VAEFPSQSASDGSPDHAQVTGQAGGTEAFGSPVWRRDRRSPPYQSRKPVPEVARDLDVELHQVVVQPQVVAVDDELSAAVDQAFLPRHAAEGAQLAGEVLEPPPGLAGAGRADDAQDAPVDELGLAVRGRPAGAGR
jgi:hypothetical protein